MRWIKNRLHSISLSFSIRSKKNKNRLFTKLIGLSSTSFHGVNYNIVFIAFVFQIMRRRKDIIRKRFFSSVCIRYFIFILWVDFYRFFCCTYLGKVTFITDFNQHQIFSNLKKIIMFDVGWFNLLTLRKLNTENNLWIFSWKKK